MVWIDLASADTTGMTDLTLPELYKSSLIKPSEFKFLNINQFLIGYLIVNEDFEFPSN
jgi:hypothetical protein